MDAGVKLEAVRETQRFSLREAARILEVPESRLRALARAGFLSVQHGPIGPLSFGFQDLIVLRTTKGLVEAGVPMRRIRSTWASLRRQLDAGVPLTSITLETDGDTLVASDGDSRWQPDSGQFLLDLDAAAIAERAADGSSARARLGAVARPATTEITPAFVPALVDPRPAAVAHPAHETRLSAEEWYELGCDLETESPEEARDAYEHALDLDPDHADAHVNLGRHLHLAGERGRAEPHYREAVRLDPDDPTPHFNLGVLLDEVGRKDEAILAYRQAILRDPDFADAHCNLGLLLESLGRRNEAMRHLMAARRLSGESLPL